LQLFILNISREKQQDFVGDVKYHMQASYLRKFPDGHEMHLTILPNPSHLETVNAMAVGKTRCKMDLNNDPKGKNTLPVLIHGDAALTGQGICYEIAQMNTTPGYQVGGSIHIVINNQIGFTAEMEEGRSSHRCTDIAKITDSLVIRANADEPEAVNAAFELAVEYRQKWHTDVYVDILGYRRHGHSEGDQPAYTNPKIYNDVIKLRPVWEKYSDELVAQGVTTPEHIKATYNKYKTIMTDAFNRVKSGNFDLIEGQDFKSQTWEGFKYNPEQIFSHYETGVDLATLKSIGQTLNTLPNDSYNFHSVIRKTYDARNKAISDEGLIEWSTAQQLAFGSLLAEGYDVRMSGEDAQRGTFATRHAVLTDQTTSAKYSPLYAFGLDNKTKFSCYNSLLSEYGVMGFEYGYSIGSSKCLTIWVAQFGDFSTVGQPVIDLLMASGEVKWGLRSALTFFLPHGIDGQGPEHSSCKLERWLQLVGHKPDFS
jgi:2-oxoglutarate dehydrogenase E1 component